MKIKSKNISKSHESSGKIIKKTENTVIVEVKKQIKHSKYGKILNMIFKYMAHNPGNKYKVGDMIKIKPCRPYSRRKTWIVTNSLRKKTQI